MGKSMNACELSKEEYLKLLEVVQRDFDLREAEKKRINALENEVHQLKTRAQLLTLNSKFNDTCCLNCCSSFIPLICQKITCQSCKFNFCRRCLPPGSSLLVCSSCLRERDFELQKNSWFYDAVKLKFRAHGSAIVVENLHQRSFFSNSEADSNKLLRDSNLDSSISSSSAFDHSSYANYKESLDSTLSEITEAIDKKHACFGETDNHLKYNEALRKQKIVICMLLKSLLQDARDELGNANHQHHHYHDQSQERMANLDRQTIEDFLTYALNENKEQFHLANINTRGLTADEYVEQVASAIIEKTIEESNSQKEGRIERKLDYSPNNRLTLAVLAKMSQEFEEEGGDDDDDNNNKRSTDVRDYINDDNDNVDLESLRSFTESKKGEIPLPPVELPLEFTKKLYGIGDGGGMIGGRPLSFVDPDLDAISMTSSSSPNVPWNGSSSPDGVPRLGGKGSFMMRRRIPCGVNDRYGTDRRNHGDDDDGDDDDNKEDNHDNDDDDDDGNKEGDDDGSVRRRSKKDAFVMFLPDADSKNLPADGDSEESKLRSHPTKRESVDDPDVLENTNLSMFRREQSLENDRLKSLSLLEGGEAPKFIQEPGDVTSPLEWPMKIECHVDGDPPIDVKWYKQPSNSSGFIELNSSDERFITWHRGSRHAIEVTSLTNEDQGQYVCVASNKFGQCLKSFRVQASEGDRGARQKKSIKSETSTTVRAEDVTDGQENKVQIARNISENVKNGEEPKNTPDANDLNKRSSSSGKQKKSSLSHRWLIGSGANDSETRSREDRADGSESLKSHRESDNNTTIEKRPANNTSPLKTQESSVGHESHKTTNTAQAKPSLCLPSSGSNPQQSGTPMSNDFDRPNVDQMANTRSCTSDPRAVTSEQIKKDFVIKKFSNDKPEVLNPTSQTSSSHRRIVLPADTRENHVTLSSSISTFNEPRHNTVSSVDDVFAAENIDAGEEEIPIKMPSVKELRKKFVDEKNSNESHPMRRVSGNPPKQEKDADRHERHRMTQDSTFRHHSYVPLSPLPINRGLHSHNDETLYTTASSGIREDQTSSRAVHDVYYGVPLSVRSTAHPHPPPPSAGHPAHQTFQSDRRISGRSESSFNTIPSVSSDRAQLGGNRSISTHRQPSQTGTYVSKVVIGSDCDIVSSCAELPKTKRH